MNLVLVVFCKLCCKSIARVMASLCFYMFLEKTKLKNDSSNDADWVRDLMCILIAAPNNYVLDAPLDGRPIAGADADVMNIWLAQYDDYLIVLCIMLYCLEPGLKKCF